MAWLGTSPACRAGEIRLVGSGTTTQGRVEVCGDNREWGKVCDNSWTTLDAQVACKQLGFSSDGMYLHNYFVTRLFIINQNTEIY